MAAPILAGDSTTVTPASLRVLILSWAVPLPPDTIAAQANQGCTINIIEKLEQNESIHDLGRANTKAENALLLSQKEYTVKLI